ncbi:hypothetical protein EW146_g7956 [Bondarzewia mesenterica]|uniref:Chromatin elongation factor SPT5 n=1 Tax=Bondarzewia mesenterica TaxID=1095465 RepID=A0A4S4LIR4_9AGAM|nr:hypothetical protein EW146_g7956 [Bondarzewia mesenterica]
MPRAVVSHRHIQCYFHPLLYHARFSPERLLIPPVLSVRTVFLPETDRQLASAVGNHVEPGSTLIPKPNGEVTRLNRDGYNLKSILNWAEDMYELIMASIHGLASQYLRVENTFSKQDNMKLTLVRAKAEEIYPILKNYEDGWVVDDFLRIFLKNSSQWQKTKLRKNSSQVNDTYTWDSSRTRPHLLIRPKELPKLNPQTFMQRSDPKEVIRFIDIEAEEVQEDEESEHEDVEDELRSFFNDDEVNDGQSDQDEESILGPMYDSLAVVDKHQFLEELAERYRRRWPSPPVLIPAIIPQIFLTPSVDDCPICSDSMVRSVFARPSFVGLVFVEAPSQAAVLHALRNFSDVYLQLKIMPVDERVALLNLSNQDPLVTIGSWVIIRHSLYKSDWAYVLEDVPATGEVEVAVVPRIPLDRERYGGKGKKRKVSPLSSVADSQPPAHPFTFNDIAAVFGSSAIRTKGDEFIFRCQTFKNGLLHKHFAMTTVSAVEGVPTTSLQDLEPFLKAKLPIDLRALADASRDASLKRIVIDDRVRITSGEQAGLVGEVLDVRGEVASILPRSDDDGNAFEIVLGVPMANFERFFKAGDHVQVKTGVDAGRKGLIAVVELPTMTFIEANTNFHVHVRCDAVDWYEPQLSLAHKLELPATIHSECDPKDPWEGKEVVITKGEYKGYRGLVKAVHLEDAWVELEAGQRIVVLDKWSLSPSSLSASNNPNFVPLSVPCNWGDNITSEWPSASTAGLAESSASQEQNTDGDPAWDPSSRTPPRDVEVETEPEDPGSTWLLSSVMASTLNTKSVMLLIQGTKKSGFERGKHEGALVRTVLRDRQKISPGNNEVVVTVGSGNRGGGTQLSVPVCYLRAMSGSRRSTVVVKEGQHTGIVCTMFRAGANNFWVLHTDEQPLQVLQEPSDNLAVVRKLI